MTFDGYIRVSKVNGRSGASYRSPSDQRAIIGELARREGIQLGEIVEEQDVSGSKKVALRELGRLVQKVRDGESGGIIVWNVKRFSRKHIDGMRAAFDIVEAGGRILAEDFNHTGMGALSILSFQLEGAQEEWESRKRIFERSRDGALDRGAYCGVAPYGYRRNNDGTLTVVPEEAEKIRAAYACVGSWLDRAEILGGITRGRARNILTSKVYRGVVGVRSDGTEAFVPSVAIVTRTAWDAVQPRSGRQGTGTPRAGRAEPALLSTGLLRCGCCGRALVYSGTLKGEKVYGYYSCKNGGGACTEPGRARSDRVEAATLKLAETIFLAQPVHIGSDTDVARLAELQHEAEVARERFTAWDAASDPLDPGYADRRKELRATVVEAEAQVDEEVERHRVPVSDDEVRALLARSTVQEKQQLVRLTVGETVIHRDGRWVPGTDAARSLVEAAA